MALGFGYSLMPLGLKVSNESVTVDEEVLVTELVSTPSKDFPVILNQTSSDSEIGGFDHVYELLVKSCTIGKKVL